MALVRIPGGMWVPSSYGLLTSATTVFGSSDNLLMDADQEEVQIIGRVSLAAGTGSKTFGNSGSKVGWLPGASITFGVVSTLRVGIKQSSSIDDANGPPGRATIGGASFDVYKDLVAGVDTITATTWRDDSMASLLTSGITVTHGDRIAVCFLLSLTSGTPSVKIRAASATSATYPISTLVTTGPTYTAQSVLPNIVLTFDDGTIGWIDPGFIFDSTGESTVAVGNGVIYANIFQLPFDCAVDAIAFAPLNFATSAANIDVGFWQTPFGTPAAMTNGTQSLIQKNTASNAARLIAVPFTAEIPLTKNTAYAAGVKQNSATNISVHSYDIPNTAYWQANGLDLNSYAATSTAGAAFSSLNSGKRRAAIAVRISSIDVTAAGGGSGGRVYGG